MRYTTVIFDLDGTLLNTLEDIRDSVNYILKKYGYPERTLEQIRLSVGNGAGVLMEKSLPAGRETPGFDGILDDYVKWYEDHNLIKTAPYEGVTEMLRAVAASEHKLAVVSNKPDANTKALVRHFFGGYVSVAIGERPDIARKPAPDTARAAMRELGSYPYETVYVGDSEVDLKTARAAGIDCISVGWGFRSPDFLHEMGAQTVITKPSELVKLV